MPKTLSPIDKYIADFPPEIQSRLRKIKQVVKQAAPTAEETISYKMPTFKIHGKYLVYFAVWKTHIGFYAMPSGHAKFKKELSKYPGAKGSVQFPLDRPFPYDLIKRIVKFRVKENLEISKKKKK